MSGVRGKVRTGGNRTWFAHADPAGPGARAPKAWGWKRDACLTLTGPVIGQGNAF